MNKTAQKKKMFLMKETLVDLTPHLKQVQVQVQGATCIGVTTGGFDIRNKCAQTSWDTR